MSQFPAIKPSGRSYVPPSVPLTSFKSASGKETRVLLGNKPTDHQLQLAFSNLLEATADQILAHYRGQMGMALSFTLPEEAYAGWTGHAVEAPLTQVWRYASPPQVETTAPGIMNVSIELVGLI